MSGRVTNADVAAALAEVKTELTHLSRIVGDEPHKGLRGEVAQLTSIKNRGLGFLAGLLLFAGSIGAALKDTVMDLFK